MAHRGQTGAWYASELLASCGGHLTLSLATPRMPMQYVLDHLDGPPYMAVVVEAAMMVRVAQVVLKNPILLTDHLLDGFLPKVDVLMNIEVMVDGPDDREAKQKREDPLARLLRSTALSAGRFPTSGGEILRMSVMSLS